MDIRNIEKEVQGKLEELDNTEGSIKRREFLNEYSTLSDELRAERAEIRRLQELGEFDEAAEKTLAIARLEAKESVMRPVYEKYLATPAYELQDLIDISKEVSASLREELEALDEKQEALLKEALEIQSIKVHFSKNAENCRKKLIRLSGVSGLREEIKFASIPDTQMYGIKKALTDAGLGDYLAQV